MKRWGWSAWNDSIQGNKKKKKKKCRGRPKITLIEVVKKECQVRDRKYDFG